MTTPRIDLLDELSWRGLLHQCTDEAGLRAHLADPDSNPRKVYIGFDPTAPSLTIGNLVQIMNLARVRQAGHIPVVVMGGGTGLIGDPSGKSAERTLMTYETVQEHVRRQRPIFDAVLGAVEGPDYVVFNNADWLMKISYLDALRDIGKFFSVNMMMQKESVKARLENREQGISYTEFSYMILQAYDFAHLYEHEGVTVQGGGSDQFGNIVAGSDLIRRQNAVRESERAELTRFATGMIRRRDEAVEEEERSRLEAIVAQALDAVRSFDQRNHTGDVFGITAPLVTKADGGKFGKTESGAIWLTADRTSPYAYYQFWLNASDADAANWIKVFTFLDQPTIESIIARHAENPGARELQRTLAREATRILHGQSAMQQAEAAGKALFSGDIAGLDARTLQEVLSDVPSSNRDRADLAGDGADPVAVLKETGLAASNREAREFIANGSVSVNGVKLAEGDRLTESNLLHGSLMALRRGKKNWHLIRWS
jgi:tyrosyl-tRNA synthetase